MFNTVEIQLHPDGTMPTKATDGAAAYDCYASGSYWIDPGAIVPVQLGFCMSMEPGQCALLLARSGLALKYGVALVNGTGLIDSDYRGPLSAALINHSSSMHRVQPGDRVAQLLFLPAYPRVMSQVVELSATARGTGGFGSTGI